MRLLFWLAAMLVAYAYVGYGLLLGFIARLHSRPVLRKRSTPSVSILIAARNEAANLPRKLDNLLKLDYPREKLEFILVSDGSTDRTAEILRENSSWVISVILEQSVGKAQALNEAVKRSTGEILIFLDTRQYVEPDAIAALVSCFADVEVGAVSGELLLEDGLTDGSGETVGIYWKIEKALRKLESASGSVVGVTGAIYAIRRELYSEMPQGTILDDLFVPMHIARMGKRVVFQAAAIARDRVFPDKGKEFSRKVRTLTGNYQLIRFAPWLLSPANPLLFRFISHKILRLLVPMLLLVMLLSCAAAPGPFYRTVFWLQVAFYMLAIIGSLSPETRRFKLVAVASTFVMLNTAAALAFYNFLSGRQKVWI